MSLIAGWMAFITTAIFLANAANLPLIPGNQTYRYSHHHPQQCYRQVTKNHTSGLQSLKQKHLKDHQREEGILNEG